MASVLQFLLLRAPKADGCLDAIGQTLSEAVYEICYAYVLSEGPQGPIPVMHKEPLRSCTAAAASYSRSRKRSCFAWWGAIRERNCGILLQLTFNARSFDRGEAALQV